MTKNKHQGYEDKVRRVVESVQTIGQARVAMRFLVLAARALSPEYHYYYFLNYRMYLRVKFPALLVER